MAAIEVEPRDERVADEAVENVADFRGDDVTAALDVKVAEVVGEPENVAVDLADTEMRAVNELL